MDHKSFVLWPLKEYQGGRLTINAYGIDSDVYLSKSIEFKGPGNLIGTNFYRGKAPAPKGPKEWSPYGSMPTNWRCILEIKGVRCKIYVMFRDRAGIPCNVEIDANVDCGNMSLYFCAAADPAGNVP